MKQYGDNNLSPDLVKLDKAMKKITKFNKWLMWFIVVLALLALTPLDGDAGASVSFMDRLIGFFAIMLTLPILFYENKLIQEKSKKYLYTIGPSLVLFLALFDISGYLTNTSTNLWMNIGLYVAALISWVVMLNEKSHKAYFSN